MPLLHFKHPGYILKQIFSILVFRYHRYIHLYLFFLILSLASWISYRQPFGLLFNFKHHILESAPVDSARNQLINQQKYEQKIAYEWLENLLNNPQGHPELVSNRTQQLHFYDYIQITNHFLPAFSLLKQHKRISLNTTDQIVISILYGRQDTDHREGKFYLGQILHHLLKNYHSRFLITLCENNNTNDQISEGIALIRRLLPVFVVSSASETPVDAYEREKQAHVQCISANFQVFPNVKYLLLLQDDAEPIGHNFAYRLLSLIDSRVERQWPVNGTRQQPAFMKIYHPRWLISYFHPSFYMITQLIATSFVLTTFGFVCFYAYQMRSPKPEGLHRSRWQHRSTASSLTYQIFSFDLIRNNRNLFLFAFYYLLITLVLLLLDHSNVSWTWRSLHPSFYAIYPSPSCCLPGVLYFQQTYSQVVEYLNSITCHKEYAIDTALDDLPKRSHLQTFLVEPNLVHHIGLYSRLRKMHISPYLLD